MATPDAPRPFGRDWLEFVGAARKDLGGIPVHRPLDQFIQVRDRVLDAVEDPEVVAEINDALLALRAEYPQSPVVDLLLQEMAAYRAAVFVAGGTQELNAPSASPRPTNLARFAKTILDSLKELLKLSPPTKALLEIFSEVFGLFAKE